jgi:hypothetical protein
LAALTADAPGAERDGRHEDSSPPRRLGVLAACQVDGQGGPDHQPADRAENAHGRARERSLALHLQRRLPQLAERAARLDESGEIIAAPGYSHLLSTSGGAT